MTRTNTPPAEIQTLIEVHVNGFNTRDNALFHSVFGDTAVIIDGIAPYRRLNTFGKRDGVWKIEAQAWGRTS